LNNNQIEGKQFIIPIVIKALGKKLKELEIEFDGGIFRQHIEVEYPSSKIESLIVHDHLG